LNRKAQKREDHSSSFSSSSSSSSSSVPTSTILQWHVFSLISL